MPVYNKLIRDKIPDIIRKEGKKFNIRTLNDIEYENELLKKFIEECQELVHAKKENEKLEELADIFELMYAFLDLKNISISQLDELRKQKSTKRGGFSNKVFLIDVED